MARRVYTEEQKADALRIYEVEGPREAARQTSIPRGTIGDWAKQTGIRTVGTEKRRANLKYRLVEEAHYLLDRIHEPQTEFVGQKGEQVEYPQASASVARNLIGGRCDCHRQDAPRERGIHESYRDGESDGLRPRGSGVGREGARDRHGWRPRASLRG